MDSLAVALVAVVVAGVAGVILVGLYVWNGLALGALLRRIGGRGWTAWIPVLGDVELLRRAGEPGWAAVLLLVPIAALYGLYRKAIAALRVGDWFAVGSGWAVAAILLPPLWATALARRPDPGAGALATRLGTARDYPGAVTPAEPSDEPEPAPFAAPAAPPEVAAAVLPPLPVTEGFASATPAPATPAPSAPVPEDSASSTPAPSSVEPPPRVLPPPPVVLPPPPPVSTVPSDGPRGQPAPGAALPDAPAPAAPPAHREPAASIAPNPEVVAPRTPGPAASDDDGDDAGETVVVDRRPVVLWTLHVEGGPSIPLSGERVLLGRKPFGSDPSAVEVAIPDSTRTLSKLHAVLELEDGRWTVTDLDSTNGVVVIEADGSERLLEPGGSAPVLQGFVLGKVGMRVSFDGGAAS